MLRKLIFKSNAAVALLLGALVAIAYAPIVNVSFLADDFLIIGALALPEGGTNWQAVFHDFYGPNLGGIPLYRPLYTFSFGIDYSLYGTDPLGYHLTNLALHAISSFFVYLIALELVPGERKREVAISAGAIFALHPIHPEAVTWIAGRHDVICAVFYLPALLFFLRWLRTEQWFYIVLSVGFFALALMSKEMAVALPALLVLCALYKRKKVTTAVLGVVPFAGTLGIYLLLIYYFFLSGMPAYSSFLPDWDIVATSQAFLSKTLHAFFPLNLGLLPDGWSPIDNNNVTVSNRPPPWPILLTASIALITGFVVAVRYFRAGGKLLILLFALYVVSLAPVLRLLYWNPVLMGSRWFYIPSAFLSIFIAYALWSVVGRYARGSLVAPSIAAGVVCVVFFAILVANNGVWVQAGEIARYHLESGQGSEAPVTYRGAWVFGAWESIWEAANDPPFEKP